MDRLQKLATERFGIDSDSLLRILESSHGADGYILGVIGEETFKNYADSLDYEVLRIKEKPKGGNNAKLEDARGDFYIRKKGVTENSWYVVECKSVKSNSEDRSSRLLTKQGCIKMLLSYSFEREKTLKSIYNAGKRAYDKSYQNYQKKGITLPAFRWSKENPGPGVPDLTGIWKNVDELKKWVNDFPDEAFSSDAYANLTAPLRLIQTHMPSVRTDENGIKRTGPLVSEFNILCVDLFLRTGKHELVFVNSQDLNPQGASPNHLQQNYNIDLLVQVDDFKRHQLLKPWYDNLELCINETKPVPRQMHESQLDERINH